MLDYIIVGQGIAGTLLSWFLLQAGKNIRVIDLHNSSSSSNISSGVINPITGRRFVKTWMADEIIPFAEQTYSVIEQELFGTFYSPVSIIKLFDSVKAQNDWSARGSISEYSAYLKKEDVVHLDKHKVVNDFGGFEITGGGKLETAAFLKSYRNFLRNRGILLEENFFFDELKIADGKVYYKELIAGKIIFCEGAAAAQNPYFNFLPFVLDKGECLRVRIQGFYRDKIIIGDVSVVPLSETDEYYVGSTHEWDFENSWPSAKGKETLLAGLQSLVKSPFRVIAHSAAIRPTVKDRRPFIGVHPQHPQIGIFNGLGTKGISLAPYFAGHFTEHLESGRPLLAEVDIKRFLS